MIQITFNPVHVTLFKTSLKGIIVTTTKASQNSKHVSVRVTHTLRSRSVRFDHPFRNRPSLRFHGSTQFLKTNAETVAQNRILPHLTRTHFFHSQSSEHSAVLEQFSWKMFVKETHCEK